MLQHDECVDLSPKLVVFIHDAVQLIHELAIITKVHGHNVGVICRATLARTLVLACCKFVDFLHCGFDLLLLAESELLRNVDVSESLNKPLLMLDLFG